MIDEKVQVQAPVEGAVHLGEFGQEEDERKQP
jgi:hypothetical protein